MLTLSQVCQLVESGITPGELARLRREEFERGKMETKEITLRPGDTLTIKTIGSNQLAFIDWSWEQSKVDKDNAKYWRVVAHLNMPVGEAIKKARFELGESITTADFCRWFTSQMQRWLAEGVKE